MSELKDILKQVGIESIKDFAYINGMTRQAMYEANNSNPYRLNRYINTYLYLTARKKLKLAKVNLEDCQARFDSLRKYKKEVEA